MKNRFWTVLTFALFMVIPAVMHGCTSATSTGNGGTMDGSGGEDSGGNDNGSGTGGNSGGGDTSGGTDNGASDSEAVVKTNIIIGLFGKIEAGDDLVVYGVGQDEDENVVFQRYNQPQGVHYIVPSQSDNETDSGEMIPGSDLLYSHASFKVLGKQVALVRSTGAVTIFDTSDQSSVDVSSNDISLASYGEGYNDPGQMVCDETYIATINDTSNVADGNAIKVMDLSTSPPSIMSFPNPIGEAGETVTEFTQVAIAAGSRRVAAAGASFQNDVYVWDMDDPGADAQRFDFPGADYGLVGENTQMRMAGDYLIYHDDLEGTPRVKILNVADGSVTRLDPSLNEAVVDLRGGSFGYFMMNEDADLEDETGSTLVLRSAIGTTDAIGSVTLASQLDTYPFENSVVDLSSSAGPTFSQEDCIGGSGEKRVGYGESMRITPDGSQWFIGGSAPPRTKDYILFSDGGAFEAITDPEGTTVSGYLTGSEVSVSDSLVAFRGLRETGDNTGCITQQDWVVSFIRLDAFNN